MLIEKNSPMTIQVQTNFVVKIKSPQDSFLSDQNWDKISFEKKLLFVNINGKLDQGFSLVNDSKRQKYKESHSSMM
ncbi:hypothetical protein Bca52824_027154 [Brassica carinata]|uniref:Uncharacterized protein n=1 Tax=Brassica carinata TaxID=52824 RepID=A0A8X7SIX4_BRACI|nr:hypothetical protein Bca52824_027154 [Brassica carinata]